MPVVGRVRGLHRARLGRLPAGRCQRQTLCEEQPRDADDLGPVVASHDLVRGSSGSCLVRGLPVGTGGKCLGANRPRHRNQTTRALPLVGWRHHYGGSLCAVTAPRRVCSTPSHPGLHGLVLGWAAFAGGIDGAGFKESRVLPRVLPCRAVAFHLWPGRRARHTAKNTRGMRGMRGPFLLPRIPAVGMGCPQLPKSA